MKNTQYFSLNSRDSTNIVNFSDCLDFGYNNKNKRSIKISALVDNNKVPDLQSKSASFSTC